MEGADGSADGVGVPYEDASVPKVVASGEVVLGGSEVGLFLEGFYLIYLICVGWGGSSNITIACLWAAGLDANGHNGFFVGCVAQSLAQYSLKLRGIDDKGIGGGHHDVSIGVLFLDFPASISDAGGGVACLWLCQYVIYWHVRYLLLDNANVFLVGDHPHVLYWADGLQTVDGELDEGTAHAHDIDELFGVAGGGHGPETAADAACHDDYLCIVVIMHYIVILSLSLLKELFCLKLSHPSLPLKKAPPFSPSLSFLRNERM